MNLTWRKIGSMLRENLAGCYSNAQGDTVLRLRDNFADGFKRVDPDFDVDGFKDLVGHGIPATSTQAAEWLREVEDRFREPPEQLYRLAIDGPKFREQREFVVQLMLDQARTNEAVMPLGDGILELLDEIADQAHDNYGIDCLTEEEANA